MDAKTLEALRGSIAKWKAIEEGRGADDGSDNCPLCAQFNVNGLLCTGCPVAAHTGHTACDESPYWDFADWDEDRNSAAGTPINPRVHKKGVRLARAEREFLESLLPEGEQP